MALLACLAGGTLSIEAVASHLSSQSARSTPTLGVSTPASSPSLEHAVPGRTTHP